MDIYALLGKWFWLIGNDEDGQCLNTIYNLLNNGGLVHTTPTLAS